MKPIPEAQLDHMCALVREWEGCVERSFSEAYKRHNLNIDEAVILVNCLVGPPNSQTRRAFLSQLDYTDEVFTEINK